MKIVVSVSGASGALYAQVLLKQLELMLGSQVETVGLIMSANARYNWEYELGNQDYQKLPFKIYDKHDFLAPFASGSAQYQAMIVVPCSMGFLGRVAAGISDDLATRAADVILKERRKLVLVTRETPLSLIHLQNMTTITQCGGIICPASPSFYSHPTSFEALAATVTTRALDLCGLQVKNAFHWGGA